MTVGVAGAQNTTDANRMVEVLDAMGAMYVVVLVCWVVVHSLPAKSSLQVRVNIRCCFEPYVEQLHLVEREFP